MRNNFVYLISALLFCFVATGCSSDDDYNADTATSHYKPESYDKMVSSITITNKVDGKDCKWKYDFVYDVQNRIKEINGDWKHYIKSNNKQYLCYTKTSAKYIYNDETLIIKCREEHEVPAYSDESSVHNYEYGGVFNENGTLNQFHNFDCEYQGLVLKKAYVDTGEEYALEHDLYNNITSAYRLDSLGKPETSTIRRYKYTNKVNKTNFDFASFFGYNIFERQIESSPIYTLPQLGTFGMFGARGPHLPQGEWELDKDGYPLTYINSAGTKYVITYKENSSM